MGSDAPDKGQGFTRGKDRGGEGLLSGAARTRQGLSQPSGSTGLQGPEPGGARSWGSIVNGATEAMETGEAPSFSLVTSVSSGVLSAEAQTVLSGS